MYYDIIIRSRNIFVNNRLIEGEIGIKDSKIVSISRLGFEKNTDIFINAEDKLVIPGTIDPHFHCRAPAHPERETFLTGTIAAAAGGVTTVCEMPISIPPPYSPEIVKKRMKLAEKEVVVDIAFYGAAGADHLEQIVPTAKSGVIAFKSFLHAPPTGREREFEGLTIPDDGALYMVLKELAKTNLRGAFHCEEDSIIKRLENEYIKRGLLTPIYHAKSRPSIAETHSVIKLLSLAKETHAKVYVVHISTPEAIRYINLAKNMGVDVVAETCPHYLLLTIEDLKKFGPYAKCNPPLRTEEERKGMWKYIRNGSVDLIGSDHAPYTKEEKEKGIDNIFNAPAGFPGVELRLPLLYTMVKRGMLELSRMIELISINPAKIFGLYPKKGIIGVGADADIVIIDPNKKYVVSKDKLFTKAKDIALVYDGWEVYGLPEITIVRGKMVYEEGEIKVSPGYGEIVKPAL